MSDQCSQLPLEAKGPSHLLLMKKAQEGALWLAIVCCVCGKDGNGRAGWNLPDLSVPLILSWQLPQQLPGQLLLAHECLADGCFCSLSLDQTSPEADICTQWDGM